ncbi:hypothetical protein G5S37_14360 [Roseimicrobium sp. ORNL1]|nr:hypothetical protein G5S37_14360 [Roseimicrobium sp. ORNL1]
MCELTPPKKKKVSSLKIAGEFIAYASPESTYAVTKPLIEGAKKSILIGIYDFTAEYMKTLLLRAMGRGVKVSLMLDLDNRAGETELYEELAKHGCECVPAPSCASKNVQAFSSSHEKVIVIDNTWVLVQSGNWSDASIPLNEVDGGDPDNFTFGNRDTGVAVNSPKLAAFFTKVLRADMKIELDGAVPQSLEDLGEISLEAFGAKPVAPAPTLLKSRSFKLQKEIDVTPILSPDNYMSVIPGWLASATKSIDIGQQYIRTRQPGIQKLLGSIVEARKQNPDLLVRIVLGHPTKPKDVEDIKELSKFGLTLGENVRLISRKHFVHCHNKLIVVDGKSVLVSSQNWSDSAVLKNREAGLLIEFPKAAAYYREVFDVDWETGEKKIPKAGAPELFAPQSLATGRTIKLNWGDYAEV